MQVVITEFLRSYFFFTTVILLFVFVLFFISERNKKVTHIFILLSIVLSAVYLIWRLLFTLPLVSGISAFVAGILLFAAELMGFIQSIIFKVLMTRPYVLPKVPLIVSKKSPVVDILIATYNEDIPILKKTITACLNLHYAQAKLHIYLCDDGRREAARVLCAELGVNYISRSNNTHAKAGNLNNAIKSINGEFVMLLDADMVPKPDFLQKTIGYFADATVGFVQTPQVFYNADPFQHNLRLFKKIPDEQDLFMQDIEKGRAYYNAVLHVGTNAVFRRRALDEIGGIPVGTITEDMATGMLIQAKGYKTLFVAEVLCTGLSVETFADLITQRERWCRGNIQVAKKWNPLTISGLTMIQRLIYADGLMYWFFGVQKMIFILAPILYLLTGVTVLNANLGALLLFWLPSFMSSIFSFEILVPKHRSLFWSHIYEIAMAPYISLSAILEAIFSRPLPFKVTPKGVNQQKTRFAFRVALPQIILFFLSVAGLSVGLWRLITSSGEQFDSFFINTGWTLYNTVGILFSIFVCVERPRPRTAERVHSSEKIQLHRRGNVCRIVDVSETGVKIVCNSSEDSEEIPSSIIIDAKSIGHTQATVVWSKKDGKKKELGVHFDSTSGENYKKVIKHIADHDQGYQDN